MTKKDGKKLNAQAGSVIRVKSWQSWKPESIRFIENPEQWISFLSPDEQRSIIQPWVRETKLTQEYLHQLFVMSTHHYDVDEARAWVELHRDKNLEAHMPDVVLTYELKKLAEAEVKNEAPAVENTSVPAVPAEKVATTSEAEGAPVPTEEPKIERAPGWTTYGLVSMVLPKKMRERYFDPMFADFQHEYLEELRAGNLRRAKWLRVVFVARVLQALGLILALPAIAKIWNLMRDLAN